MAAYESFAEEKVPTSQITITIDKPSGVVENDLMVAFISDGLAQTGVTVDPPGGWSTLESGRYYGEGCISCFYKVAGDSEPSDYTFTFSTFPTRSYGFILRISGVNTSDPINIHARQALAPTTNPECPDVETTEDGCLILRLFGADETHITEDSGYPSEHTGITVDKSGTGEYDCCGGAAWAEQETAGATGIAYFTMTEEEGCCGMTVAIESGVVVPTLLAGTAACGSTAVGLLTKERSLAGTAVCATTTSGSLTKERSLAGTAVISSAVSNAPIKVVIGFAGTAAIQSAAVALIVVYKSLVGISNIQSTAQGVIKVEIRLSGVASIQCITSGVIKRIRKFTSTVTLTCTTSGNLTWLGVKTLAGTSVIQCATVGILTRMAVRELAGTAVITCTAIGYLTLPGEKLLAGTSVIKSSATGILVVYYGYRLLPPFMEKDVIDPYSGGAWLWLIEIIIPTQTTQRIARNPADVRYGGKDFTKGNFDPPGRISLTGDGSIPRIQLQVAQDETRVLENIVNATKGGENGTIKIIRTCEKFLEMPAAALEATYDILTAGSDFQWVTFVLGIPNPLTQRIPLWSFSSKVCPLATPSLFKGPRCQYVGEETVCTGLLKDCRDNKNNAVHWGAEAGLDPNAVKV